MIATPEEPKALVVEEFEATYLVSLDTRLQRSESVGVVSLRDSSAALFFDAVDARFTLVMKTEGVEEAAIFDCVDREQWGRKVMVFGHATPTGGYIASGHATLTGKVLTIKLASGRFYRLDVDPELPHLKPYFVEAPVKPPAETKPRTRQEAERPPRNKRGRQGGPSQVVPLRQNNRDADYSNQDAPHGDESEDLTAEDLRRLRGEIPLTGKKRRF
jgi:hypothetical protein